MKVNHGGLVENSRIFSFPPVIDENSRVLILGSMPSRVSLEKKMYYAHPQNAFWRILESIFGGGCGHTMEERARFLLKHGIALWDVVGSCFREGSLDSGIRMAVPNDLEGLLRRYPRVGAIYLNGEMAERLFRRHFPALARERGAVRLPSTSPANAGMSFESKLRAWSVIAGYSCG